MYSTLPVLMGEIPDLNNRPAKVFFPYAWWVFFFVPALGNGLTNQNE
ncbi:hypothetical protein [Xanthovirga aplysinae]|nr:hypothetical protein [Xanthovirga aplysinae]